MSISYPISFPLGLRYHYFKGGIEIKRSVYTCIHKSHVPPILPFQAADTPAMDADPPQDKSETSEQVRITSDLYNSSYN